MWNWNGIETFEYSNINNSNIVFSDLYTLRNKLTELDITERCTANFNVVFTLQYSSKNSIYYSEDNNYDHLTDRKAFMVKYFEGNADMVDNSSENRATKETKFLGLYNNHANNAAQYWKGSGTYYWQVNGKGPYNCVDGAAFLYPRCIHAYRDTTGD